MNGIGKAMGKLKDREEQRLFFTVLIFVFAWGLLAHAYCFTNLTLSHDSLNEFYLSGPIHYAGGSVTEWKISLGRFLNPPFQEIFLGKYALPWLTGMLSLLWLTAAVWFIVRMFSVRNRIAIALISGICTVNLSVTALAATYLHDLNTDMFAVCAAAGGAYCWSRGGKRAWILVPTVYIALGVYQSMLSVAITLILFMSILRLMENADAKGVFLEGLKAAGMIVLAGALYLVSVKLVCAAFDIAPAATYNGLTGLFSYGNSSVIRVLIKTYRLWFSKILKCPSVWSKAAVFASAAAVFALIGVFALRIFRKGKVRPINIAFALALTALLPLGMNLSCFADGGNAHDLMMYSFWLIYMVPLLLSNAGAVKTWKAGGALKAVTAIVIFAILWSGVQTANTVYVRKNMEREATFSKMTRVAERIERTEGYVPGETEVVFIGTPENPRMEGMNALYRIVGCKQTSPVSLMNYYACYFDYILQTPIRLGDRERSLQVFEMCSDMPVFPDQDSVRWVDGSLVIRMTD